MGNLHVSVMGDSISTYAGYNPKDYAVYYDLYTQRVNKMGSARDTWWSIVLNKLHAELCVNGSYSGSKVSGREFPAAESADRISVLKREDGISPDMILVYIGFNDFGCAVNLNDFTDAYENMLSRLKEQYTSSEVICGTIMKTYIKCNPLWKFPEVYNGVKIDDYNEAIKSACSRQAVIVADTAEAGIYETLDCTHPTVKGHSEIADAWMKFV